MADAGANTHSMAEEDEAALTDIVQTPKGLILTVADGSKLQAYARGNLKIAEGRFPGSAGEAHLFRDLESGSLLAMGKFTRDGNQVTYTEDSVTVSKIATGEVLLEGYRDPWNKLYYIDLLGTPEGESREGRRDKFERYQPSDENRDAYANIAISHTGDYDFVRYWHRTLGSPTTATLIAAIEAGYLSFIPKLTAKMVRKHDPQSMETALGHSKRTRQKQNTTKVTGRIEFGDEIDTDKIARESEEDRIPKEREPRSNKVMVKLLRPQQKRNFMDSTGRFPIASLKGNEYLMVFYCQDSNAIHAVPYALRDAGCHTRAFDKGIKWFEDKGFKPEIERLDNEMSEQLVTHMEKALGMKVESTPPGNKRANQAERAIQTLKDHMISTYATADKNFPMDQWDEMQQILDTLNMIRGSHISPKMSAYQALHGAYDNSKYPLIPFGVRVCALDEPGKRGPFVQRCEKGFNLGCARRHHRCHRVYIDRTKAIRVTDTMRIFPEDYELPGASVAERMVEALNQLAEASRLMATIQPELNDEDEPVFKQMAGLSKALTEIVSKLPEIQKDSSQEQRVAASDSAQAHRRAAEPEPGERPQQEAENSRDQRVRAESSAHDEEPQDPKHTAGTLLVAKQRKYKPRSKKQQQKPEQKQRSEPGMEAAGPVEQIPVQTSVAAPDLGKEPERQSAAQQSKHPKQPRSPEKLRGMHRGSKLTSSDWRRPEGVSRKRDPASAKAKKRRRAAPTTEADSGYRRVTKSEDLSQVTTRQLKGMMTDNEVPMTGCVTREDMIEALIKAKVEIPRSKLSTRGLLGFVNATSAHNRASTKQKKILERSKRFEAQANASSRGQSIHDDCVEADNFACATTDETTGEKLVWRKLVHPDNPSQERWLTATSEEWTRLIDETQTLEFIDPAEKERGRTVSYMSMAPSLKPDASGDLTVERVRGSYGGNVTDYTGLRTANTASMVSVKTLMNAVVSDPNAKCMAADAKNFYLMTELDKYEYMSIDPAQIPQATFDKYKLATMQKTSQGNYMVRVKRGMYGLPHAGRLAMLKVTALLADAGYHECKSNKMVFKHDTRDVVFTLVVDDFLVKYVNREDAEHLMSTLEKVYVMKTDWEAKKYLGITLDWDYTSAVRSVRLSMPNYVAKGVSKFSQWLGTIRKTSHGPGTPAPIVYGAQQTKITDTTAELKAEEKTMMQSFVGYFRYYAEAIDSTQLVKLGQLGQMQSKPTETTKREAGAFLDYVNTWPDASVVFYASDMILRCVSDGSHRGEPNGGSRVAGFHYFGTKGSNAINGAVQILCRLLDVQSSSACETELGAVYENARVNAGLRTLAGEMGHPQSAPTEFECDNKCAVGIACDTEKQKRAAAMDMRFLWVADRVRQGQIKVTWSKGEGNLADYFTKIHPHKHHRAMRKHFVQDAQCYTERQIKRFEKKSRTD